ncbi:MAG: hypothetical protein ACYSUC_02300 [Planctomycetota bacterium]
MSIKQIVRGSVFFDRDVYSESQQLQDTVDPNKSFVLLSDTVNHEPLYGGGTEARLARNGAILVSLDSRAITIRRDAVPNVNAWVSYQIIEYK